MLRSAILDLMDWRRQLMTGTFTLDHLRDLRLRITSHIDWGNRYVSFPFFLQKKNTIFQGTLKEKQNVKKKNSKETYRTVMKLCGFSGPGFVMGVYSRAS